MKYLFMTSGIMRVIGTVGLLLFLNGLLHFIHHTARLVDWPYSMWSNYSIASISLFGLAAITSIVTSTIIFFKVEDSQNPGPAICAV